MRELGNDMDNAVRGGVGVVKARLRDFSPHCWLLHDGFVPAGPNGIRFDARDYKSSPFRLVRYFLCSEK
ncbi:uncharacterized protein PpBr36_11310 [Pyricularia pennisetigena]|uniref:uncharacterized protein n=1 Tax=Pyricularia pennisetigena TaxID=1578925 RepID=UPI001151DCF2|nr:uncharacterized protein PpBr36_11310 [Pyricularia pennisetigena]TLS20593.1 hypothetical protein PpBr36_11310 [Pyricularia pennisetigena]